MGNSIICGCCFRWCLGANRFLSMLVFRKRRGCDGYVSFALISRSIDSECANYGLSFDVSKCCSSRPSVPLSFDSALNLTTPFISLLLAQFKVGSALVTDWRLFCACPKWSVSPWYIRWRIDPMMEIGPTTCSSDAMWLCVSPLEAEHCFYKHDLLARGWFMR